LNYLCKIELYGAGKSSKKKRIRKKRKAVKGCGCKAVDKFRSDHLVNPTPAEKKFGDLLKVFGFKYEAQKIIKTDDGYKIADFYLVKYRLVIEIDGGYHEGREVDDDKRTRAIEKRGKDVIRFSNEEVLNGDSLVILEQIILKVCPESMAYFNELRRGKV